MKHKILLFLFLGSLLQAQVRIKAGEYVRDASIWPSGIAADASGNVFAASPNIGIYKISPLRNLAFLPGTNEQAYGIAVDASGNLYVSYPSQSIIQKLTPDGVVSTLAGSGTAGSADGLGTSAEFNYPAGLAVDAVGNVYVSDTNNNRIRKISPLGEVSTLAGSTQGYNDGSGLSAKFDHPAGLAVDADGNVYVADSWNHKIRKITASGDVSTLAGSTQGHSSGTVASAKFDTPAGVAVDGSGIVYVVDKTNDIRKISPEGFVFSLTTIDKVSDSTDPSGIQPGYSAIALDMSGNIFVADTELQRLLKITVITCDLKVSVSTNNVTCKGSAGGSASVSVSGGSGVYSYLWSVSSTVNKKEISDLKAGSYNCKVTDSNGCESTAEFVITEPANSLSFANTTLGDYDYGVAYNASLTASGGTGKITYFLASGKLPEGFSLSSDGIITGTSQQASQSSFTITASDESSCSAQYNFSLKPSGIVIKVTVLSSQGKKYGEKDPVLKYTIFPELQAGDSFTGSLERTPGESPGVYAIGLGTLSAGSKYLIDFQEVFFTISKADQTIVWDQNPVFGCDGENSALLNASSDSGLDVEYASSDINIAAVVDGVLTFKGYGSVAITASQSGNSYYGPANPVTRTFTRNQNTLIRKQFSNVIFFDNSSKEFKSYSWYKNGVLVPGQSSQYFKESGDLNGVYYAVAQKNDGSFVTTCALNLSAGQVEESIKIVPNPVFPGSDYQLVANMQASRLKSASIEVYSTSGTLIESKTGDGTQSSLILKAPYAMGIYIVKMTLSDGKYFSKNLLVGN